MEALRWRGVVPGERWPIILSTCNGIDLAMYRSSATTGKTHAEPGTLNFGGTSVQSSREMACALWN